MSSVEQSFLATRPRLFIRQRKEWTEILVDWETRNQYAVTGEDGGELGRLAERAGGIGDFLKRGFLRSHRGFEIAVTDVTGQPLLHLSRGFFWLFSDLDVGGADGRPLGHVRRRFGLLYKRYDLEDEHGRLFARVASPRWRLWTFPVHGEDGAREAVISKKWGGLLREAFADADTFGVDYGQGPWSPAERAVIFAAAISIDFDFFENNQGRSGGLLGS